MPQKRSWECSGNPYSNRRGILSCSLCWCIVLQETFKLDDRMAYVEKGISCSIILFKSFLSLPKQCNLNPDFAERENFLEPRLSK